MRQYEEEAKKLETSLREAGVLTDLNADQTLIQLVNIFGYGFFNTFTALKDNSIVKPVSIPEPPVIVLQAETVPNVISAPVALAPPPSRTLELSADQKIAWEKLRVWATNNEPYFVLRGYAGTGKTFLLQLLKSLNVTVFFSAPTNKATKVLAKAVDKYPSKTTYSLLGLRMEQVEDKLILTQNTNIPPYFPSRSIIVIDEASMVGLELFKAIDSARVRSNVKILYVGDPAQLPPVGEKSSASWKSAEYEQCRVMLKQVMRFDNQLLTLATALRLCQKQKNYVSPIKSDHTDTGVWKWKSRDQFLRKLLQTVSSPDDMIATKIIAWRNKEVEMYNNIVRNHLGFQDDYNVGDVILLAEPIESNGQLLAHTDDEFKIIEVQLNEIEVGDVGITTWQLYVEGDQNFVLNIPKDRSKLDSILARKADTAKKQTDKYKRKTCWLDFWETKSQFNKIRYGYALTAHRSQGSTYHTVYVDQMDILSNPNKREAFRCLYVACTRPAVNLHTY